MSSEKDQHAYSMTIDLNILRHLGVGLYSSTPAVLSEVVANAWDADATRVTIDIRPEAEEIEIIDDGIGMTRNDINTKYLRVGYQKRKADRCVTARGRHVMGRKGIGKLSVFSIARYVIVHSVKDGARSGLQMDRERIQELMESDDSIMYHPEPVPDEEIRIESGTRILLRKFDKRIGLTASYLRRRLARRFSVIGQKFNFSVEVDGVPITPQDRDYYSKLEFIWHLGQPNDEVDRYSAKIESHTVPGDVGEIKTAEGELIPLRVTGWIGTVDRPESIDENNNALVILAHGKLVHENILPDFREAGVYADYVVGEINADFLDLDSQEDIVTSGRQSLKENDQRFELLVAYVGKRLKEIKKAWGELRRQHGTNKALENPVLKKWFDTLKGDRRKTAESLFGKIEALRLGDQAAKIEIYRSSLLAFEKLALGDALSSLAEIESESDFKVLTRVSGTVDDIEAALYHDIVRGRLEVIRKFMELKASALESVLQQYIFDHLWLLDASWERAATKGYIEQTVAAAFAKVPLSEEERKGRIDIRYRTAAGKHIIIELKKYDAAVNGTDLLHQIGKYRRALQKCLKKYFPEEPTEIEAICLLGQAPGPLESLEETRQFLAVINARWYTYDQLLKDTTASYQAYLDKEVKARELAALLEELSASIDAIPTK